MTPKEKAEQLFNQYVDVIPDNSEMTFADAKLMVKKSALIVVDEILGGMLSPHLGWKEVEYWEQVKAEIEKL